MAGIDTSWQYGPNGEIIPAGGPSPGPGQGGGEDGPNLLEMLQELLGPFNEQLDQINPQFLNADFADASGTLDPIIADFMKIGQGGADPRFAAFQNSQFNVLRSAAGKRQAMTQEQFGRRGFGGSGAELGALAAIEKETGMQEQNIASQLGLQQLGRQDNALLTAGNLGLQRAESVNQAQQSELDARQAGLTNLLANPTLITSLLAALAGGDEDTLELLEDMLRDMQDGGGIAPPTNPNTPSVAPTA